MKLYELTERYTDLFDLACEEADDDGRITQDFADALRALDDQIDAKLESCCKIWKSLEAQGNAVKAERQRLEKREASLKNRLESLKDFLKFTLQTNGIQKRQIGIFSLRLQRNSQPSVNYDESLLPAEAWTYPAPVVSKSWIKEAIDSGKEVPGAYLETGVHVRC